MKPWMTQAEYRANLNGLNIFFGAALGFVLAGTETLDAWRFTYLLAVVTGIVVSILYVSASRKRVTYAIYTLAAIAALPFIVAPILNGGLALPSKLQPTLAVWAIMTCLIEFAPREKPTAPPAPDES